MNKNTGDGEVDKIFFEFHKEADTAWKQKNYKTGLKAAQDKAKAAIKKYAAQEANKAQRQLLQELMEEFQEARTWEDKSQRHAAGIFLDNDDQVIGYNEAISHGKSVIQNKLEGLQ